jgi:iron(III) transport system substrate-binding protein
MRSMRPQAVTALAAVGLLALAGCGGTSSTTSASTTSATTPATGSASPSPSPAGAAGVQPLVVYSAQGYDTAVTKAFTDATGIPVQLVDDSTGPLLTKIAAERNNPQWDVLWVDGDTAFAALDKQGQLASYAPAVDFTAAAKQLIPANHTFTPTGTTVMAALIYNAARSSTVPTSYQDLLGSAYTGKIGMNDPSQSGPTYPFIAGLMNQLGGQAQGQDYLSKLKANGLKVFNTNGDTLHALETGQIDYGLIQSSAAIGETIKVKASAQFDPKIVYVPKSTLLPGVVGIDKNVSQAKQDEAKKFVDFVLSAKGQQAMQAADPTGDSLYWPPVNGVPTAPGLPAFPTDYQRIDPYFWGPLESQINTWFDANIK